MNKDFYDLLPGCVCEVLDNYITEYQKEVWFEDAWEQYRQHVLKTSEDKVRMPGYIFKNYVGENHGK